MDREPQTLAAGVLRHYTDAVGKEGIDASGRIRPGAEGLIFLTSDTYDHRAEAQAKLALPRQPVGFFEIPIERISNPSLPETVPARFGQPGGGTQISTAAAIEVADARWFGIRP